MNSPNRNPINIRLRRSRWFYFHASANHKVCAERSSKKQKDENADGNQYFYPELHALKNEKTQNFLHYNFFDCCNSTAPHATCTVPIERYSTRLSGMLRATRKE
jgi:hypothetical protein